MNRVSLLFAFFAIGLLIGCEKDDSSSVEVDLPLGTIEAVVDGRQFRTTEAFGFDDSNSLGLRTLGVGGVEKVSEEEDYAITFTITTSIGSPIDGGTYTYQAACFDDPSGGCIQIGYEVDNDMGFEYYEWEDAHPNHQGVLTLDRYDSSQGPAVRGTFEAVIYDFDSGRNIVIERGRYNVIAPEI